MNKYSLLFKKPRVYVFIFFLAYLVIGVSIYKDYGISWDEPWHREIAGVSAKYMAALFVPDFQIPEFASLPSLAEYPMKQYGVVFDLPLYVADILLGFDGTMPEVYYLRHLFNFLLFYAGVFFFYLIVRNRYDSRILGLTGSFFLILSPRIFAESFYGKDIAFLSLFIISIYFFIRYLNRRTIGDAILFAFATALVVDQRITGMFIPFVAVLVTVIDEIKTGRTFKNWRKRLLPLITYVIAFSFFMVLFWPYLWGNPVRNLIDAFAFMGKFPAAYDILYMGAFIKSTEVPWHYIPVWMLITTPILYIFFFLMGSFLVLQGISKNRIKIYANDGQRQDFLFLLLFIVPLAAVIVLHSTLYDGWRHLYFIYAPFLLIAMTGTARVLDLMREVCTGREKRAAFFISAVIVSCLVATSCQMIRHHPFQNVYFNILAGKDAGRMFELDYWGLSFRRGLEYIVKNDKRPVIGLSTNAMIPMINNAVFLEKQDRDRLRLVDIRQADYFLTNYRWHPEPYPLAYEVYTISAGNSKIMSIYKLR